MAYRDDVEALEARLRGLDTALTQQTRERDAAAQLLAEARERADQTAARFGVTVREAARRRRRWRLLVAAAGAAIAIAAGAVQLAAYIEHRRVTERAERFLDGYQAAVRELCSCGNEPCARERELEARWQFGPPYSDIFGMDEAGFRRLLQIHALHDACALQLRRRAP